MALAISHLQYPAEILQSETFNFPTVNQQVF